MNHLKNNNKMKNKIDYLYYLKKLLKYLKKIFTFSFF